MVDKRAQELIDLGNRLYREKLPYDGLCQEIAWQFAPDLADFTRKMILGEEWADHLMDSFPVQCSRDLSNALSAMLRPKDRPWFKTSTMDDAIDKDENCSRFLEHVTKTIRAAIYNPRAKFVRATKEADRFYVNFGMAVIEIDEDHDRRHLLFRSKHIRDCAWLENKNGDVDHMHVKDPLTARQVMNLYRRNASRIHESIREAADKEPNKVFDIRVLTMPRGEYDYDPQKGYRYDKSKPPFVRVHIDATNQVILREEGRVAFPYIVPRWRKFAGFQYAFSEATMPALSDARMAQMMTHILLEAGEKAVNPPLVASEQAIRQGAALQAGAITWADIETDQKIQEVLAPIQQVTGHMAVGFEMRKDIREMLAKSFFLDKLTLPEAGKNMTATEVQRRLEEHVRNLLPLFEPMEVEYNTRILDTVFTYLRFMGKFDFGLMPPQLRGADISWTFESPIQQAQDRLMVEQAKETWLLESMAMKLNPGMASATKADVVLRDAVRGIGGPAMWRKNEDEQAAEAQGKQQAAMMQNMMQMVGGGAEVAGKVGEAAQALRDGGVTPAAGQGAEGDNPLAALMGGAGGGMAGDGIPLAPADPSADLGLAA